MIWIPLNVLGLGPGVSCCTCYGVHLPVLAGDRLSDKSDKPVGRPRLVGTANRYGEGDFAVESALLTVNREICEKTA